MIRQAYTSTVIGPIQFGLGLLCAAAVTVIVASTGTNLWITIVIAVAMTLAAVHLSTVRISVGDSQLCIGQGPWNRPARKIAGEAILAAHSVDLRWAQTFGIGVAWSHLATRMTVRPGPTLYVELNTGEQIRISTPDPAAACELLPPAKKESL